LRTVADRGDYFLSSDEDVGTALRAFAHPTLATNVAKVGTVARRRSVGALLA
jgi:hypothetical protein